MRCRSAEPALAAAIELRARAWVAEHGADFPGDLETGMLGTSDEERERFEDFANEAACPALDPATGRCDVYALETDDVPGVRSARSHGRRRGDFYPPHGRKPVRGGRWAIASFAFMGLAEAEVVACEMTVPHELEAEVLEEIGSNRETVVAFAVLRRGIAE